jgi:1-aminocyclopropane-1-carboxylate deaminase/D-cysteine desulfhydrase-like pyridoxal-dependent ACC family enzyme
MTSIEDILDSYPRVSLTRLPTPLHPLPHLSARLGLSVSIKRDDLTDLVFGGDKPRKLEYEVAQALAHDADTLVTCGSSQSNHARLTTAAARRAVGKETGETAHVERWNNTLRQRLVRFVRMTLSFSKSEIMHEACLLLFLHRYNLDRAILLK